MKTRGFTLLEILIALAIFATIGLASTAVLSRVIESDRLSTERFERLQSLQRAMLTIERDMLQLVARKIRLEGETNSVVISGGADLFQSEADGIGFIRSGWQNPKLMLRRSTLQAVAYRLQEQKLHRMYGNYVDNVIGHEPKVKTILEGVEDFQVEFLAEQGKDPTEARSWSESFSSTQLPYAVAITIESTEFGKIRREFLVASSNVIGASEEDEE